MILKKIGKSNLQCEKKSGEIKWFKATPAVIKYSQSQLKVGDSIIAEFNDKTRIIEKVTKASKSSPKSTSSSFQEKMVERSVLASVSNLEGVTFDNLEEAFQKGMALVTGKSSVSEEPENGEPEETQEEEEPEED